MSVDCDMFSITSILANGDGDCGGGYGYGNGGGWCRWEWWWWLRRDDLMNERPLLPKGFPLLYILQVGGIGFWGTSHAN
jgi:hypothetical protein